MNKIFFDIDVVGSCNLRCPSCPQGNIKDYRLTKGEMDPELLSRIVRKAASECEVGGISLFSWGEPLLHARINELISIVQRANIDCHMSSNLNILPDADAVMAASPASFKISVSGFSQEVYGFYHRGGNIEKVKKNMAELAAAKKRNGSETRIYVSYHRYRHNLREESLMRDYACSLGIDFQPEWALMFPLEKILGYLDGNAPGMGLTGEDEELISHLAIPVQASLDPARDYSGLACILKDETVSMDFQGNVQLCCGIFDARAYTIGNYLEMPLAEIQRVRRNHSLCERCMNLGAHLYLTYRTPGLEDLITGNIPPEDSLLLDIRHEFAQKRRQLRLQKIYQTFFSRVFTKKQKALLKIQIDRMFRIADRS